VARIYGPALDALDVLDGLRANVDAYQGARIVTEFNQTANESFLGYTALVKALANQNSILSATIEDDQLRRGVQLVDLSSREIDTIAQFVRVSLLAGVTGDRRLADSGEIAEAGALISGALSGHQHILDLSTGHYAAAGHDLKVESQATGLLDLGPKMVLTGQVDIPAMLRGISIGNDQSYYGYVRDVSAVLQQRADDLNAAAQRRSRWYVAAAGLVIAAAVAATLAVSRSIVRPLRQLTRQSIAMAERHLPAAVREVLETPVGEDVVVPRMSPVTVDSRDEVADVADTLNTVQSAAVSLAVDQAMLRRNVADAFINLARRNQNLLSRQLDFITELERDETHTAALENLFRLDHLATRMRRNAESLLVLAGAEAARQWSGPVQLHDVVRAALGEVEDYQRVVIRNLEAWTVLGSVASDLAHLLAELVENALRFSPPDREVEISGRSRSGAYLLLIADEGFGMSPPDLAAANERLSRNESFSLASPRFLGHHVAGNLAARHGIGVRLHPSPCAGVTATVDLPSSLLAPGGLADGMAPALGTGPAAGPPTTAPAVPAAGRNRPGGDSSVLTTDRTGPAVPTNGRAGAVSTTGRTGPAAPTTGPAVPTSGRTGAAAPTTGRAGPAATNGRAGTARPLGPAPTEPPVRLPRPGFRDGVPDARSATVPPGGRQADPALDRRIPGAQMPTTTVHVRRTDPAGDVADGGGAHPPATPAMPTPRAAPAGPAAAAAPAAATRPPAPPGHPVSAPAPGAPAPGSPDDVYRLLTSFADGVDRGRRAHGDGSSGPAPAAAPSIP
jgi:signal transduction histidine kinase